MNKAIWIIGLASAVLSLPYLIESLGANKSVVIVEQLLVQPTTDESLSGRKAFHTDDLATVTAQDQTNLYELEGQPHATDDSISTINTLLKNEKPDGYNEESRAELIENLLQKIDPKLAEIHQSLKVMDTMNFPEKERYKKVAQLRIMELEELKAGIRQ
jgi:hypothetical protein